jgi:hypothetical protein
MNPIPSFEIRWFFKVAPPALTQWFGQKVKDFQFTSAIPSRVDFYLPLPASKGMSVKLREGNIEIKQLIKNFGRRQFGIPKIEGKKEHWVKWSFDLNDVDSLAQEIIKTKKYNWLEVPKERFGFKYHFQGRKKAVQVGIKDRIPEGCQVEFTRILVKGKEYYSFGLEAFSESSHEKENFAKGAELAFYDLTHWNMVVGKPIPEVNLPLEKSMGYPEFLEGIK